MAFGFGNRGGRGRGRGGFGHWGGPPPWAQWAGAKAHRGDVRGGLLALLAEQPRNGYQLMQELEQRSSGMWNPSPGSVYPALQQLEDEGLIQQTDPASAAGGTGRTFQLTDKGRQYVKEHPEETNAPWNNVGGDCREQMRDMFGSMKQVGAAMYQVFQTGSAAQVAEAKKVLAETVKQLYRILANDTQEQKNA
jgi:DNA-binding PadR family transcriptional regulator